MSTPKETQVTAANKQLPVFVEQDEGGYYVVECPLFQGCYSQGESLDEALANIREVIDLLLEEEENQTILREYKPKAVSFHTLSV